MMMDIIARGMAASAASGGGGQGGGPKIVTISYDPEAEKWSADMSHTEIHLEMPNIVCKIDGTDTYFYNPRYTATTSNAWVTMYRIVETDIDRGTFYSIDMEEVRFYEGGNVVVQSGHADFNS